MEQNTVGWRSKSQCLVGDVTRILLKGEDLNQKFNSFPKIYKLRGEVSKPMQLKHTTRDLGASLPAPVGYGGQGA